MPGNDSRIARAGDYILGLMNDSERERAERDLEVDPAFRDAVIQMAERMRVFDRTSSTQAAGGDRWKLIAGRLSQLPQMREADVHGGAQKPPIARLPAQPLATSPASLPHRHALAVALGLAVAFALGYLAGRL